MHVWSQMTWRNFFSFRVMNTFERDSEKESVCAFLIECVQWTQTQIEFKGLIECVFEKVVSMCVCGCVCVCVCMCVDRK